MKQYCEIGYETIKWQSCYHVEASQMVCPVNQLTGFYMIATLGFNKLLVYKILEEKIIHYQISNFFPVKDIEEKRFSGQVTLWIEKY